MRVVFFGTPALCIPYLDMLSREHELVAIVCNPDQPTGRRQVVMPPPTKQWGLQHAVTVLQPEKLKGFETTLVEYGADIFVVVAYGKIIPEVIIKLPYYGTLNVHYSLLPRWRGASPVEAAVLAGDNLSGVCIQQMRFQLDSGPIWASEDVNIGPSDYARTLRDGIMGEVGVRLLKQTLETIQTSDPHSNPPPQRGGNTEPAEQIGEPTFCYRIKKSDGELLDTDDDLTRWRKYRAYHPWPGVFYFDESGARVKINEAVFDNDHFVPTVITKEGEKPMRLV